MLQDVCSSVLQFNLDTDSPPSLYVTPFTHNLKLFQLWKFTADGMYSASCGCILSWTYGNDASGKHFRSGIIIQIDDNYTHGIEGGMQICCFAVVWIKWIDKTLVVL